MLTKLTVLNWKNWLTFCLVFALTGQAWAGLLAAYADRWLACGIKAFVARKKN